MEPKWFFEQNLRTNCKIFTNSSLFIQHFMTNNLTKFVLKIQFHNGPGTSYTDLGQIVTKFFLGHNLAAICQIFTNNPLFFSKFYVQYFTCFLKLHSKIGNGTYWEVVFRFEKKKLYGLFL